MKEESCFPGFNKMRTNWTPKPVRDEMIAGVSSRIGGARGKAKDDPSARFFEVHADSSDEHSMDIPAALQSNPFWNSDVLKWKPGR